MPGTTSGGVGVRFCRQESVHTPPSTREGNGARCSSQPVLRLLATVATTSESSMSHQEGAWELFSNSHLLRRGGTGTREGKGLAQGHTASCPCRTLLTATQLLACARPGWIFHICRVSSEPFKNKSIFQQSLLEKTLRVDADTGQRGGTGVRPLPE